jgi:hypothetical protein
MLPENGMTEQNKKIIGEFVHELTNKHNVRAWDKYCGEHFVHHFSLPNIPNNLAGSSQSVE